MHTNRVKQALKEGRLQVGCAFGRLGLAEVATILGKAGLDWAYLDAEHGGFGVGTLQELCHAAVRAGLAPIVRVADIQYDLVARSLDCGAQGILLPRIESPEALARAVSWSFFPPVGVRGYGLSDAHLGYEARTIPQMIAHLNAQTMVVLQIETKLGLERRDEILAVPGIDAVMVGPADLSVSLGIPGEFEHSRLVEAIEQIRDSCLKHKVAPGIHMRSLKHAKFWRDRGMKFISCGNEALFLFDKVAETAAALRG